MKYNILKAALPMLAVFLFLGGSVALAQPDAFFAKTDRFLKAHVSAGRVDYAAIQSEGRTLAELVQFIREANLNSFPEGDSRKAFWINTYNILVIQGIVAHLPIQSPQDVGGFFDRIKYTVAGNQLTLNDIENRMIRDVYGDARIHFVLVCAAVGCPSLIPEAYVPDRLDAQLQERTRISLNMDLHVRLDAGAGKVYVSELFKWYKVDFVTDGKSVIDYINQFRQRKIPVDSEIGYTPYDWRLNGVREKVDVQGAEARDNLQSYTPSTLLAPGEMEIKLFNNLYTQTAFFNESGDKIDAQERSTFFTGIASGLYGIKRNVNIGLDVFFKSVENDQPDSSPFSVFNFASGPNARTAIASIAPKLKITPFKNSSNLALQTTLVIPVASDLEGMNNGRPFVDFESVQWWTQLFYDTSLSESLLAYFEGGVFLRFGDESTTFLSPAKAFLNYYPSSRITTYLQAEFGPTWDGASISNYYSQAGVGAKYQLTPGFELEGLYTIFPFGKNGGAGSTYNIGFRIIR